MKTHKSSTNKNSQSSLGKKLNARRTNSKSDDKKSSGFPLIEAMPIVNGFVDIGSNIAGLLTEKERTTQVIIECQRDVAISNNEVEKVRLEMNDRRSERIAEQEKDQRAQEQVMQELERKGRLQDHYIKDRSDIIAEFRAGKITIEEYKIQIDSIEKGIE